MARTQTPWTYQGNPFKEAQGYCGFTYLVSCTHPSVRKMYIGYKLFYSKFGKKTLQKESDWKTYRTSSKHVQEAFREHGDAHFTWEIIQLFKTRGGVVAGEVELMWAQQVLHATREDGERLYWNGQIGGVKFIPKERISEETRKKMLASWTPERRAEKSKFFSELKRTEEHCAKISANNKRTMTPERKATIAAIGLKNKGKAAPSLVYTDQQVLQVFKLQKEGLIGSEIAAKTNIKRTSVYQMLRKEFPRFQKLYAQFQTTHHLKDYTS